MKTFIFSFMLFIIGNSSYAFQFQTVMWKKPNSCAATRASCQAHFDAGCRVSGNFQIPAGTVYCDMNEDGGGWTRLNGATSTSTIAYGASDGISGTNNPQGCGGITMNFSLTGISVTHTKMKYILTRTTTVIECPTMTGSSNEVIFYQSGTDWISQSTNCTWNTPWSHSTFVNDVVTTGIPLVWKMLSDHSAATMGFSSQCSNGSDNGTYTVQVYVK